MTVKDSFTVCLMDRFSVMDKVNIQHSDMFNVRNVVSVRVRGLGLVQGTVLEYQSYSVSNKSIVNCG